MDSNKTSCFLSRPRQVSAYRCHRSRKKRQEMPRATVWGQQEWRQRWESARPRTLSTSIVPKHSSIRRGPQAMEVVQENTHEGGLTWRLGIRLTVLQRGCRHLVKENIIIHTSLPPKEQFDK